MKIYRNVSRVVLLEKSNKNDKGCDGRRMKALCLPKEKKKDNRRRRTNHSEDYRPSHAFARLRHERSHTHLRQKAAMRHGASNASATKLAVNAQTRSILEFVRSFLKNVKTTNQNEVVPVPVRYSCACWLHVAVACYNMSKGPCQKVFVKRSLSKRLCWKKSK